MGIEIEDVIAKYGITPDGARKIGLAACIFMVMLTTFTLIAPTYIVRLDATTVTSGDWTHLLVFGAAVVSTLATAIVAGVVATKVVDRWRPSPPVPDGVADHRSWLTFPYLFAILCYATIKPTAGFPGASGLYVVSDQSWLRVEAPADLAYEVIATLAIFTLGYAAGIAIKWGWGLYAASLAASKAEAQAERAAAKLAKANRAETGQ